MSPEAENLTTILARIGAARKGAIAPAALTQLIAVGKTHGPERIRPLLEAGHRVFGENRVQEAQGKWPALKAEFPDIELHLIGPLQTNKVRDAVELFDVIHTLDRPKLADALRAAERRPDLLVQVNTGEEPQKAGLAPEETAALIAATRDLPVKGLMCIPPADVAPAPHFALLAKLAREGGLDWLSMGMSGDFEIAVRFGATHVRVGTALFGDGFAPSEQVYGKAEGLSTLRFPLRL
jgi:PLP dependent protein